MDYYKANEDKRQLGKAQDFLLYSPNSSYVSSPDCITYDMIFSMTEDWFGNIWFATRDHGICCYDRKKFTSFGRNEGFISRGATAILQDGNDSFWITTVDSGVWRYNGKIFKNFSEDDGLVNNAVMTVLKDKDGRLWFGAKYFGLSCYDRKSLKTFSQYDN